jgi:hypothetical protein
MIWNPFSHMYESKSYPYTRFIRSSFRERIKDTFKVFNGDFYGKRMGLFDYVFPFPRIASYIFYKLNSSNYRDAPAIDLYLGDILFLLWSIPTVILNIPKLIVTSFLTLLVSPVIVITHFWFKPAKEVFINQIKRLKIQLYNSNIDNCLETLDDQKDLCEERDLINVLPDKEFKLLSIRPLCKYPAGSHCTYSEYAEIDTISPRLLVLGLFSVKPTLGIRPSNLLGNPLALIKVTSQNETPIKALLNTNMFWTTQHLENPKALPIIESMLSRLNP